MIKLHTFKMDYVDLKYFFQDQPSKILWSITAVIEHMEN